MVGGGWAETGLGIIESPQHSTFQRKGGHFSQSVPLSAEMLNIVVFLSGTYKGNVLLSGEMLNPAGSPFQKCASFWGKVEYVQYVQFLGKHCPPQCFPRN